MATLLELAKDASKNHNYQLSCEMYERLLQEKGRKSSELYFAYADSLAHCSRIKKSLDIYAHICFQLCEIIPVERLKYLANSIIEFIITKRTNNNSNNNNTNIASSPVEQLDSLIDPLCCPICEDVLKYPVTSYCGHSYCRACCFGRTKCIICGQDFPIINTTSNVLVTPATSVASVQNSTITSEFLSIEDSPVTMPMSEEYDEIDRNNRIEEISNIKDDEDEDIANNCCEDLDGGKCGGFEQDILVRRLVEKWWGPHLKASELNDEAEQYLKRNLYDEALKCCNQSLEIASNNFKGLLLRSHVLHRLKHYQSSLADVDNAIKSRPFSYKCHYRRALALSGLGRIEEAFISICISICLDRHSENLTNSLRLDLAKLLQRLLASNRSINSRLSTATPYPYGFASRARRRQRYYSEQKEHDDYQSFIISNEFDYEDGGNSSCGEGEDYHQFLSRSRTRNHHHNRLYRRMNNINTDRLDSQQVIPRQNTRMRSLFDRMTQEIEKYRRAEPKTSFLSVNPSIIESSDFDCVLCCRTLYKPVVTPCGHTYCLVCLDRCMDYSSYCPLCMAPLIEQYRNHLEFKRIQSPTLLSLSRRSTTRFVEEAMKRFIPNVYAKRQMQELEKEPSIPIFICTNAFPTVSCPLFIYEPRYRLMIRRTIESGSRQFGIVLAQSNRQKYADYGTILDIRDCVQLNDGCSILSTLGTKRFRVIKRSEKDGYETAHVELIKDEPICDRTTVDLHYKVLRSAKQWCGKLPENIKAEILKSFGQMPDLEEDWQQRNDGPSWTWWIIAILPLSPLLKVNILATTSLDKRLRAIEKTLNEYMAAQQKRALCLMSGCEGLPTCQAFECCQRATSTNQLQLDDRHPNQSTEYLL